MSGNVNIGGAEALVQQFVSTKNPDLRDEIVRQYTGLVERVARKYSGLEPFEDLVQVGFMGLLNALNLFEPSKGVRFNTYATHLVAGSIKHHLRDKSKIIREPAWLQEVRHKVNKAASQMQHELGRTPTDFEIAERTDVTPQLVREVLSTEDLFKVSSLTAASSAEEDGDGDELDFAEECADQLSVEEKFVLDSAISELRGLEQDVLQLFHFQSLSQTEISQRLGISANYVSHILRQSLSKLRAILHAEERNDRTLRRQMSNLTQDVIDEMTEAYSEEYMIARLDEECARASCDGTTVAFIRVQFEGLDKLRQFYGPQTVESFLRDACAFLRDGVRRLDIVGRFGEMGFGIVLPGAGNQVTLVCERVQTRILDWLSQDSVSRAGVRVLFAAAHYPESGRNAKRLMTAAALKPLHAKPKAA